MSTTSWAYFSGKNANWNGDHLASIMPLSDASKNVFLTGFAGTGKSVVIREFVRRCSKKVVCLAPTGLAAVNLGQASTIHSFFEFKPASTCNDMVITPYLCEKIRRTDVFLIDEISMVISDLFWRMEKIIQTVMNNGLPFGGKQVIVCGDFYQLPPVVADEEYRRYIDRLYCSEFALRYAFMV